MRCLVVANQTLGGPSLSKTVSSRAGDGAVIRVVVPATEPAHEQVAAGGTAADNAQRRLDEALARFKVAGVEATGMVGPADPMQAIREALAADSYDRII